MAEIHLYDIIRRPVVTEKSSYIEELGKYVFEVHPSANKIQVREAVEIIFDVDVVKINTMIMPAKRGRRGRAWYKRTKQWKKAVVTLEPGQEIKLFSEV